MKGLNLTIEDVYTMQQMCAYEVCAQVANRVHDLTTGADRRDRIFQVLRTVHGRGMEGLRLRVSVVDVLHRPPQLMSF